jgi:hypothetical protein
VTPLQWCACYLLIPAAAGALTYYLFRNKT